MAKLRKSLNFVSEDAVPSFSGETALYTVFTQLEAQRKGGFIVNLENEGRFYVKGEVLGNHVTEMHSVIELGNLKIENFFHSVRGAFISVSDLPPPQFQDGDTEEVFKMSIEGYYFSDEPLINTLTQPFARYCTRPKDPHLNYNTTSDRCRVCMLPLKT